MISTTNSIESWIIDWLMVYELVTSIINNRKLSNNIIQALYALYINYVDII